MGAIKLHSRRQHADLQPSSALMFITGLTTHG